ncbi:MAG: VWA domain-containing protein [Polyangia bacterium]
MTTHSPLYATSRGGTLLGVPLRVARSPRRSFDSTGGTGMQPGSEPGARDRDRDRDAARSSSTKRGTMPHVEISCRTDRALALGTGKSRRFVWARLRAPLAPEGPRRPLCLGLVLDCSASMEGERLALAQQAAIAALARLAPQDCFTVVAYDSLATVLCPTAAATPVAKQRAIQAILGLQPREGTNLFAGWQKACEQLAPRLSTDAVARVLLITDGEANCGFIQPEYISLRVEEQRRGRITTSTVGVGPSFNEWLLGTMADAGGGNFYYAQRPQQLPPVIEREVSAAFAVIHPDTRLVVSVPAGASVECLNRFPVAERFRFAGRCFDVMLGDLASDQQVSVVLQVELPEGPLDAACALELCVVNPGQTLSSQPSQSSRIEWRWVTEEENTTQARDVSVTRETARLFTAMARQRATRLNQCKRYEEAAEHLLRVARNHRRIACGDPFLLSLAAQLERDAEAMREPLSDEDSKSSFTRCYLTLRGLAELEALMRL